MPPPKPPRTGERLWHHGQPCPECGSTKITSEVDPPGHLTEGYVNGSRALIDPGCTYVCENGHIVGTKPGGPLK